MGSPTDLTTSTSTVDRVVTLIGIVAIVAIVGIVVLLAMDKEAPEGLIALAAGAVGSLGTLLASTRSVNPEGLLELGQLAERAAPASGAGELSREVAEAADGLRPHPEVPLPEFNPGGPVG